MRRLLWPLGLAATFVAFASAAGAWVWHSIEPALRLGQPDPH